MPQKYKRKEGVKAREPIPQDILKKAVDRAVGGEPLHTVAKEYGLSRNTLRRYVRKITGGGTSNFISEYNKKQVFTDLEEEELAKYLEIMARMNHGLTTTLIDKLAYELAVKNKKDYPKVWDEEKKAGYFWRRGFLSRRPELSLKKPEATSLSRATSFNKHNVSQFFENLLNVLKKDKFGAESIWNADETGVTTVQKCPKVIAPKKLKQVGHVTSAERGSLVTICNAVNALGNSIPPYFVFPRVKTNPAFLFGAPEGSDAAAHISGWMTEETFLAFLKHFVKYTRCSQESKILLLLDNHESHLSLAAVNFARSNGIVILTFPPHCSHRLQPLDVSVYGPFKNLYNQKCTHRLTIEKPGVPLTIYNVAELVGKAFSQSFTPANIISGFKNTGIWPYNENIFTEADFLCSYVTDRPQDNRCIDIGQRDEMVLVANPTCNNYSLPSIPVLEQTHNSYEGPSTSTSKATESRPIGSTNIMVTSTNQPQTSNAFVVSPENILPYPKANQRKTDGVQKRKRGRTMVATDTPNKNEIEASYLAKIEKKNRVEEKKKVRKSLFVNRPKSKAIHVKKKKQTIPTDSETSNSEESLLYSSESELESDIPFGSEISIGDWLIVKFCGKKQIKRFVGQVLERSVEGLTLKFARRFDETRFKWPENDDISEVDRDQVEALLKPPEFSIQNDRITSFVFKTKFKYVIE